MSPSCGNANAHDSPALVLDKLRQRINREPDSVIPAAGEPQTTLRSQTFSGFGHQRTLPFLAHGPVVIAGKLRVLRSPVRF